MSNVEQLWNVSLKIDWHEHTQQFGSDTLLLAFFASGESVGVAQTSSVTELATGSGSRIVVPRRIIAFTRSSNSRQGTSLC